MTTHGKTRGGWADLDTLQLVRPEVRRLLEASQGFARLSEPEKKEIASTMVKVAAYMANPDGLTEQELAGAAQAAPGSTLARAQDAGSRRPRNASRKSRALRARTSRPARSSRAFSSSAN